MIPASIVRRTRFVSTALLLAPLAVLALGAGVDFSLSASPAVGALCLAGLVVPAIVHRRYHGRQAWIAERETDLDRARALRSATLEALGITSAVALAGAIVYLLTGDLRACAGPALHLLVGASIWPTEARVARVVFGVTD